MTFKKFSQNIKFIVFLLSDYFQVLLTLNYSRDNKKGKKVLSYQSAYFLKRYWILCLLVAFRINWWENCDMLKHLWCFNFCQSLNIISFIYLFYKYISTKSLLYVKEMVLLPQNGSNHSELQLSKCQGLQLYKKRDGIVCFSVNLGNFSEQLF